MACFINHELNVYTKKNDIGVPDSNSTNSITNGKPIGFDLYDIVSNEKVGKVIIIQDLFSFSNLDADDVYTESRRILWFKNIKINDELKGPGSLCTNITDSLLDAPLTLFKGEEIQAYSLQGSVSKLGKFCNVFSIRQPESSDYGPAIKIKFCC